MATTTKSTRAPKSTYQNIKKTTKKLNDEILSTSKDIVEGTLESTEQWQVILEKGLKGGTKLLNKQQDLMLDTLEGIKNQVEVDVDRYTKLLGLEKLAKRGNSIIKSVKNFAPKLTDRAEDVYKEAKEKTEDVLKTVKEKTEEATKAITDNASKFMGAAEDKTEKVARKSVKAVKKTAKTVTKKATKKVVPTVKASVEKIKDELPVKKTIVDLKIIDGIGPKMEEILNNAGIVTVAQIAEANYDDLKAILDAAGPRYNMFNPQLWIDQAKKS
jgi:predicted flap endonuclease-1-like 5' DNA nuclease